MPDQQATWTLEEAVEFATKAEEQARVLNLHVGLTGSVLYGGGTGKDLDILVYAHTSGHVAREEMETLMHRLRLTEHPDYWTERLKTYARATLICVTDDGRRVDMISA